MAAWRICNIAKSADAVSTFGRRAEREVFGDDWRKRAKDIEIIEIVTSIVRPCRRALPDCASRDLLLDRYVTGTYDPARPPKRSSIHADKKFQSRGIVNIY